MNPENIVARGRISALVERTNSGGYGPPVFEYAERPPGVRVLLEYEGALLFNREWRDEHRQTDLRLPGGKVFDTFVEYEPWRGHQAGLEQQARQAARKELYEETTIQLESSLFDLLRVDECGATVRWRLYYFEAHATGSVTLPGRIETAEGECTEPCWMRPSGILEACLTGQIRESRTVAVLAQWLGKNSPELFNLSKNP
jgi:8-oxo-dGTP pyrophosphatase MutT (NUDIX family)